MLFRIAVSPKGLGWSPATFWSSTAAEFEMGMEGLAGDFKAAPFISREEVRRIAAAYEPRPSIASRPDAVVVGTSNAPKVVS